MTFPSPAERRDMWWHNNYECSLPTDAEERTDYLTQLAHEATHGPAAGLENDA